MTPWLPASARSRRWRPRTARAFRRRPGSGGPAALERAAERCGLALPGHAEEGVEAGHVLAAGVRQVAALGEAPERRFGIAGERPVHAAFPRIVGGERERPVAVAVVEEAEIMRGGARGPLGVHAVVAVGVHHQPEAAGGGAAELPEPALPAPSAGGVSGVACRSGAHAASTARNIGRAGLARMGGGECKPLAGATGAATVMRQRSPGAHPVTPPARFGRPLASLKRMF